MKELIKDMAGRKIKSKKEANARFSSNLDNSISKIAGLKRNTENQNEILNIFMSLIETFIGVKANEKADGEVNEEADKEQTETTDMPLLIFAEYASQRRKLKRPELKILTPDQVLSRLPISLVRLKVENISEKIKNEIRQVLYILHCSKKLNKT